MLVYGELLERYFFTKSLSLDNAIYSHTRKELEEAGFGWVFDCRGIEIEDGGVNGKFNVLGNVCSLLTNFSYDILHFKFTKNGQ